MPESDGGILVKGLLGKRSLSVFLLLMMAVILSGCIEVTHKVEHLPNGKFRLTSTYLFDRELQIPYEELVDYATAFDFDYELIVHEKYAGVKISKEFDNMRMLNEELAGVGIYEIKYDALFETFEVVPAEEFVKAKDFIDDLSARIMFVDVQVIDPENNVILAERYVQNLKGSGIMGPYVPRNVSYAIIGGVVLCLLVVLLAVVKIVRLISGKKRNIDLES